MNLQKGFVIPLIIAIVAIFTIGGGLYYSQKGSVICWPYCKNMTDQDRELIKQSIIDNNKIASTTDETKDWKTYNNEKYGFEFKYPNDWKIEENTNGLIKVLNPSAQGKPDTGEPSETVSFTATEKACTDSDWNIGYGLVFYKASCLKSGSLIVSVSMSAFSDKTKIIENEILSTFRSATSVDETKDWKTYYLNEGGKLENGYIPFEIGYLSNWKFKEFSYNTEGVVFCPQDLVGCGVSDSGGQITGIIFVSPYKKNMQGNISGNSETYHVFKNQNGEIFASISLSDIKYKKEFDEMILSFKFTK